MEQVSLTLRIDEDLHKEIRKMAYEERRSINNIINFIIRKYLEEKKTNK